MNREQLLAARPKLVKSFDISGIGSVNLRVLTGREALALDVQLRKDRDTAEGLASIVAVQLAAFICDEAGAPILSLEDAAQLIDQWSAGQVRSVISHGAKLNALGEASVEEAGGN
jgi:hypothetical protein